MVRTTANQRISMLASCDAATLRAAFPQSEIKRQNQIYLFLRMNGWAVGRVNVMGRYSAQSKKWFMNPRTMRGMPDLLAFKTIGKRKIALAAEIKSAKGKQSPHQKQFEEWWHYPAGDRYYILARSVEDVEKILGEVKNG